jgi:hypothetical protein
MAFRQAIVLMPSSRRQSAAGSFFKRSASGVAKLGGAAACRWRGQHGQDHVATGDSREWRRRSRV